MPDNNSSQLTGYETLHIDIGPVLNVGITLNPVDRNRRRTDVDGLHVELAAVADLLEHVRCGDITADAAISALIDAGQKAERAYHPDPRRREAVRCFNDCGRCTSADNAFQKHMHEKRARQVRRLDPERYPYVMSNTAIHRNGCPHVGRHTYLWQVDRIDEELADRKRYLDRRHWFAHDRSTRSLPYDSLTPEQAASWIARRTGSQGGRNYRLCKTCEPDITAVLLMAADDEETQGVRT